MEKGGKKKQEEGQGWKEWKTEREGESQTLVIIKKVSLSCRPPSSR